MLIMGVLLKIIDGKVDKKVDLSACHEWHEHMTGRLNRGNQKFSYLEEKTDKLLDIQAAQGKLLARIDERTTQIAKQNGAC